MSDDDADYRRKLADEMAKDAWKTRDQEVSNSLAQPQLQPYWGLWQQIHDC